MPRSDTPMESSGRRTGTRRPSAVTAMATRSLFVSWPNGDSTLRLSRQCRGVCSILSTHQPSAGHYVSMRPPTCAASGRQHVAFRAAMRAARVDPRGDRPRSSWPSTRGWPGPSAGRPTSAAGPRSQLPPSCGGPSGAIARPEWGGHRPAGLRPCQIPARRRVTAASSACEVECSRRAPSRPARFPPGVDYARSSPLERSPAPPTGHRRRSRWSSPARVDGRFTVGPGKPMGRAA